MAKIIVGRFIEQVHADAALADLVEAGFDRASISVFFVNSPGKHDLYPVGGDEDHAQGTKSAGAGAAAGAAGGGVVGAAAGSLLGPAGALAGAAVGAYVGSLSGALDNMHGRPGSSPRRVAAKTREAGMLIAVATPVPTSETEAVQILRACGATDIERNDGEIRDGDWVDFDPLAEPGRLPGEMR
ncbi:MAG: hypothetical protein ABI440_05030 [Casimicrobiaceae bacterium]